MKPRELKPGVFSVGAIDPERRLFDAFVELPKGTSYNAYLIKGREKTALLDTVDPSKTHVLMENLADVERIDYIVSHHAEQDHSGSIPHVLDRYPKAKVLANERGAGLLKDHLHLDDKDLVVVKEGDTIELGEKTLEFISLPWVHWPETMGTFLREDGLLFTCDLFGSHLASGSLFASDETGVIEEAKRYYAEIMMPFRSIIKGHLAKLKAYGFDTIAPSHGPVYDRPREIMAAYSGWVSDDAENTAVIAYVTMHGSTLMLARRLADGLARRGIRADVLDLAQAETGALAMSLVDSATLIIATPTFLTGMHPLAAWALHVTKTLRPKLKNIGLVGSYGWAGRMEEEFDSMVKTLKAQRLGPVVVKGMPRDQDMERMDALAQEISQRHKILKASH